MPRIVGSRRRSFGRRSPSGIAPETPGDAALLRQILAEALQYAGEAITEMIDEAAQMGGLYLVRQFVEFWEQLLVESDFTAGCPVVAAAIGSADDEPQLTTVAGNIFRHWREALTRAFVSDGFDEPCAASLAIMCIASLEGAVVLCRSTRSVDPLRAVTDEIEFLIKSREFVRRHGLPTPAEPAIQPQHR